MNVGAHSHFLQLSVLLRWYTMMLPGSARGVWWGLFYRASYWLASRWPNTAGSLEMSDMILRRAEVPRCSEVTGTVFALVVVRETFAPTYRWAESGSSAWLSLLKKVCQCNRGFLCVKFSSLLPVGSVLSCTHPEDPFWKAVSRLLPQPPEAAGSPAQNSPE